MRILVASRGFPWPTNTGARLRLHHVVRALSEVAPVDLFVLGGGREQVAEASIPDIHLIDAVPRPDASPNKLDWARWLVTGDLPFSLWFRDYVKVAERYTAVKRPEYALTWLSTLEPWFALHSILSGPVILDLFDLEDHKERTLRNQTRLSPARRMRSKRNEKLWKKLQQRAATSVSRVVVCSKLDRSRLGIEDATVVPNGYELAVEPVGKNYLATPPTILFVGFMHYEPNLRAAEFLVRRIAPQVWKRMPDVHFRVVGDAPEEAFRLNGDPRVTITGLVDSIEEELARGDMTVVPLQSGSGTRIKILEAFAHKIPVISTRLGAEGLEIEEGKELLIAETVDEFSTSIIKIIENASLRRSLTENAHRTFLNRYRWRGIRNQIAGIAQGSLKDQ